MVKNTKYIKSDINTLTFSTKGKMRGPRKEKREKTVEPY